MSQTIRISQAIYDRLGKHSYGFEAPAKVIERLIDHYEGLPPKKISRKEKRGTETMNRKKFVTSVGATCKNWTWSWSFINEEEKFILFGAWTDLANENGQLILGKNWVVNEKTGRKSLGYPQALEHINLIRNQGYQLKTFEMKRSLSEDGTVTKIESFKTQMDNKSLNLVDGNWYAT